MFGEIFGCCIVFAVGVTIKARSSSTQTCVPKSHDFVNFQRTYLCVFFLVMAADWLQGPYVYDLYSSYGFSQHQIAVLFVAGFGSSFVFGTYVGSLADRFGRKRWALLYVLLYSLSCLTKHFPSFEVLMVGRLLGGVSTSLLFSVFESWMVTEHHERGFAGDLVADTFSLAMLGNSIVAILSGIVAQQAADAVPMDWLFAPYIKWGGCSMPFDVSILCLCAGGIAISTNWQENFGSTSDNKRSNMGLGNALRTIVTNRQILLTGLTQSLFEASMFTFVFMWTPALTPQPISQPLAGEVTLESIDEVASDTNIALSDSVETAKPPYGLIFATYMVCCMAGSSLFTIASKHMSVSELVQIPLFVGACSLAVPVFTTNTAFILFGFLVFEVCVGMYFPAIGTLKSQIVPDHGRSAIYNLFRVPLNMIVLGVLLSDMAVSSAMSCCVFMLGAGFLCATLLHKMLQTSVAPSVHLEDNDGLL